MYIVNRALYKTTNGKRGKEMVVSETETAKKERVQALWDEFLAQSPTNEDLRYVIEWVKPLREEAGKRLLAQSPTNEDLRYVIEWVEPLREEAQRFLDQRCLPRTTAEIMEKMRAL